MSLPNPIHLQSPKVLNGLSSRVDLGCIRTRILSQSPNDDRLLKGKSKILNVVLGLQILQNPKENQRFLATPKRHFHFQFSAFDQIPLLQISDPNDVGLLDGNQKT